MNERESAHLEEQAARQQNHYRSLTGDQRKRYFGTLRESVQEGAVEQDHEEAFRMDAARSTDEITPPQSTLDSIDPSRRDAVLRERQEFEDVSQNELLSDERKEAILKRMVDRDQERSKELYDPESASGKAMEAEEAKALEAARETIRLSEKHGEEWSDEEEADLIRENTADLTPSAETLTETVEKDDAKIRARAGRTVGRIQDGVGRISQTVDQPLADYIRRGWRDTKEVAGMPNGRIRKFTAGLVRGTIELVGLAGLVLAKGAQRLRRWFRQR